MYTFCFNFNNKYYIYIVNNIRKRIVIFNEQNIMFYTSSFYHVNTRNATIHTQNYKLLTFILHLLHLLQYLFLQYMLSESAELSLIF